MELTQITPCILAATFATCASTAYILIRRFRKFNSSVNEVCLYFLYLHFCHICLLLPSNSKLGGRTSPDDWSDGMLRDTMYSLGDEGDIITVEVNNVLIQKKIHNVFGVIKGYMDAGTLFCFKQLCRSN